MTTNQLTYFITAAECLNFTEAGKRHYISQTAITQHIQSLEEQLGVKLFIREKKHVELTPAGKVFLTEARAILERNRSAIEKTRRAANGVIGNLNIGYVKGQENAQLRYFIREFHQQYPSIYFQLFRKAHLDLFWELDHQKLDVIFNICYESTQINDYQHLLLHRDKLYAVLYPSHSYAQLSSIRRYDLRNDDFLLTKYYDNQSAKEYTYFIPENFAKSGFIPNVAATSSDAETLLALVAAGIGITVLPESVIRNTAHTSDLVFIPLEGDSEYVDLMAIWRGDNENTALEPFLEILKGSVDKPPVL